MNIAFDKLNFLLILLPGFVFVWFYHRLRRKPLPKTEFEYIGLSFVWGLIFLTFISLISNYYPPLKGIFTDNEYSTSLLIITTGVFIMFGFGVGYSKDKIYRLLKIGFSKLR